MKTYKDNAGVLVLFSWGALSRPYLKGEKVHAKGQEKRFRGGFGIGSPEKTSLGREFQEKKRKKITGKRRGVRERTITMGIGSFWEYKEGIAGLEIKV